MISQTAAAFSRSNHAIRAYFHPERRARIRARGIAAARMMRRAGGIARTVGREIGKLVWWEISQVRAGFERRAEVRRAARMKDALMYGNALPDARLRR